MDMDISQLLTIIVPVLTAVYVFYLITMRRIDRLEDTVLRMENHHREDMKNMDEKWERLFERLLIQDKNPQQMA